MIDNTSSSKVKSIKSQKTVEKAMNRLLQLMYNVSDKENSIFTDFLMKKYKIITDGVMESNLNTQSLKQTDKQKQLQKLSIVGFKASDFQKISKYKIIPNQLPSIGTSYDESFPPPSVIKKNKIQIFPLKQQFIQENLFDYQAFQNQQQQFSSFKSYNEISFAKKEKEINKLKKMSPKEVEEYEKSIWQKQWISVMKNVVRRHKYFIKAKSDIEAYSKRQGANVAREARKRMQRGQRLFKEYIFRAKRMFKEVQVFYRRKERELIEIKKRKEKLELELQKKKEEEEENLRQRKRLEFLMKQSDIYSHFMGKKMGLLQAQGEESQIGSKIERKIASDIEIDEQQAYESVQNMINEKRKELAVFEKEQLHSKAQHHQQIHVDKVYKEVTLDELRVDKDEQIDLTHEKDYNEQMNRVLQDQQTKQFTMIDQPSSFKGQLKQYQLKGLRWLDNLYEQGINGILADEMGLGKTIQAIALLAHLAEHRNQWGPYLIVAPATTLYQWQHEITRFCPSLKVLPFWGQLKERKTLKKFFNLKYLGSKNSPYHIVVTSYQMTVLEDKALMRIKWQYVILDEAQAIKNINSQRWQTLIGFPARNKLLLTGTPIQNTMAELWALLHFIMPKLFDSHEHFQEWFSKDIEAHSIDQKTLNQHQLTRLHAILKPFMLRRLKKDVENEIGQKLEYQHLCEMTKRQSQLYQMIKNRLSVKDFFKMIQSKQKVENLMNLVMQFRKVCNHPELFERRPCRSPFSFHEPYYYTGFVHIKGQMRQINFIQYNPIIFNFSKLIYDELSENSLNNKKDSVFKKFFNIFIAHYIYRSIFQDNSSFFSFSRFQNLSIAELQMIFAYGQFFFATIYCGQYEQINTYNEFYGNSFQANRYLFNINKQLYNTQQSNWLYCSKNTYKLSEKFLSYDIQNSELTHMVIPTSIACPITIKCQSISFTQQYLRNIECVLGKKILYGYNFKPAANLIAGISQKYILGTSALIQKQCQYQNIFQSKSNIENDGSIINDNYQYYHHPPLIGQRQFDIIEIPDFASLVSDSAKLKHLDQLLIHLKKDKHRVLIFCQMTKMLDILEDFMTRKKYQYFRLDGSCNPADRRDMVIEFQRNPNIFIFLLSTRAGGLGVTLTAADTVIFYDNDWNPTIDAQATDRVHRIGQTKKVRVFRLTVKSTIEEKILKRAQQKQTVQSTVYSGDALKADVFKPSEIMQLLFEDNEVDMKEANTFLSRGGQGHKKGRAAKKVVKANTFMKFGAKSKKVSKIQKIQEKTEKTQTENEIQEQESEQEEMQELDFGKIIDN